MSLTTAVCNSYKQEVMNGTHASGDTYMIALIKHAPSGTFDATTTNYSALSTDEASGTGYTAGGQALSGYTSALTTGTASIGWSNAVWASSSISADGALIYNARKSNKAVCVINFADTGSVPVTSSAASFTVQIPSSGVGQVRLS